VGRACWSPIWIPKVFNARTGFFSSSAYEGIHSGGPTALFGTTPTAAERQGISRTSSLEQLDHRTTLSTTRIPAVLTGSTIHSYAFQTTSFRRTA